MRHFNGLQSLLLTLGQAYKELGLLMCLLFVAVLTFARLVNINNNYCCPTDLLFSSLIYFAERDSSNSWTFPESFWWGMMVLTTVGAGDKSPVTWVGQVCVSLPL